jgi:hypothetical protein
VFSKDHVPHPGRKSRSKRAEQIIKEREKVLKAAFERHPNQRLSGLTNHRRMKVIR